MKLKRLTYGVLQILSISLTDKTHLRDLFDKTNFNNVKDLNEPLIPELLRYIFEFASLRHRLLVIPIWQ